MTRTPDVIFAAPAPANHVTCAGCNSPLVPDVSGPLRCPHCNWHGEAYVFAPRAVEAKPAEAALTDDATCVHHPRKKAVAVCAGTGDYICSLCAVDVDGQTYGAEYLNAAGKEKASKAFDRILPRPDSQIVLYLILIFIPYVNAVAVALAFVWIPHAFFLYFKALRLRRENEIFRRVCGRARVVTLPILLSLYALLWLTGAAFGLYAILNHRS